MPIASNEQQPHTVSIEQFLAELANGNCNVVIKERGENFAREITVNGVNIASLVGDVSINVLCGEPMTMTVVVPVDELSIEADSINVVPS